MVREGWNELAIREILEQPAYRNLLLWSTILMMPLQIGYHILVMATTLQKWLNVMPGIMWPGFILLLIFYFTKSTSKSFFMAINYYFRLTFIAHFLMLLFSIILAVMPSEISWTWAELGNEQGMYWILVGFSFAEIVQYLIVAMVTQITAKKIKARLGSGTPIY